LEICYNKIINNLLELTDENNRVNAKSITKKNLTQIEIEIFSFCNRQCWFCPNSFIDRHSTNNFMDENLYLKILSELQEIDYSNIITYSRYNEPLSDKIFLTRLKQARKACPNAELHTNSNGDYITKEYLDELVNAGLNSIAIQCYFGENENFDFRIAGEKAKAMAQKLDLGLEILEFDVFNRIIFKFPRDDIKVTYSAHDFKKIANNRGDTLKKVLPYERTSSCLIQFKHLYIDYNGSFMACCNLRSDIEKHKDFILGNANESSIFEVFMGEKIINYRKKLGVNGKKIWPCDSCKFAPYDCDINLQNN